MSTKLSIPPHLLITNTENHCSHQTKAIEHFEKVIFPYLEKIKVQKGYTKEQMSLVVIDTFKGQDDDERRKICAKNSCEIVIIHHNLTNKFQPLDIRVPTIPPSLLFLTNAILGLPMKCRSS